MACGPRARRQYNLSPFNTAAAKKHAATLEEIAWIFRSHQSSDPVRSCRFLVVDNENNTVHEIDDLQLVAVEERDVPLITPNLHQAFGNFGSAPGVPLRILTELAFKIRKLKRRD